MKRSESPWYQIKKEFRCGRMIAHSETAQNGRADNWRIRAFYLFNGAVILTSGASAHSIYPIPLSF